MSVDLNSNKLLVGIDEAAVIFSVSRSYIYKLINAGDLQVVKMGTSVRVTMDSMRAFVQNRAYLAGQDGVKGQ